MSDLQLPELDPTSDRPVFKQIADHLRAAIDSKSLSPGEKLPSESQLISHYDVARMTVRHALQILQSEGLTIAGDYAQGRLSEFRVITTVGLATSCGRSFVADSPFEVAMLGSHAPHSSSSRIAWKAY